MTYYLGIDGGGTKTKVIVMDGEEKMVYEGTSGPSSTDTVSPNETLGAFHHALQSFFDKNPKATFKSVFIGLGGIVSDDDCKQVEDLVLRLKGVNKDSVIRARNDMENALYSGLLFDEGIALICGTGMVAFGKNQHGETHKAGGWGYKEGDFGSSYDLGMRSLRHVIKAFDGRETHTAFSNEVSKMIGMESTSDYVKIMNKNYTERTWIASLAPLVTKHALLNDSIAQKIVWEATQELSLAVDAVRKRLKIESPTLVIVGSLGHAKGYHETLVEALKNRIPDLKIISPQVDPAYAAALMAKKLIK